MDAHAFFFDCQDSGRPLLIRLQAQTCCMPLFMLVGFQPALIEKGVQRRHLGSSRNALDDKAAALQSTTHRYIGEYYVHMYESTEPHQGRISGLEGKCR
jgi:hypothetical protein